MTNIIITPSALPPLIKPLPLGIRGENEVTQVTFDFSAWAAEYGAGVVQLLVKRAGDAAAYPVLLSQSGAEAVWTVSATDLAAQGVGEAIYVYTVGTQVKKSCVLYFYVCKDLGTSGPAPDPYTDWIEQLTALAAETQQAALDAAAASQAVQDMGVEAEALPAGSTPTVKKSVDPETGAVTLTFGLPAGGGGGGAVDSVNGKTGTVVLTALDVGAVSTSDYSPEGKTSAMTQAVGKDPGGKLWTAPPDEVYWATYNTTDAVTIAEKMSGSVAMCKYNDRIYTSVSSTTDGVTQVHATVTFKSVSSDTIYELYVETYANFQHNPPTVRTTWTNSSKALAPLASPAFTGTPTAPTAASGTSTTQLATCAFVQGEIIGKQDDITASGILKGDGAGGVSEATAGTDYQTPIEVVRLI